MAENDTERKAELEQKALATIAARKGTVVELRDTKQQRALVRVTQPFTEMGACYGTGDIAGFPPVNAVFLVDKGWAAFVSKEEHAALKRSSGSGLGAAPVAATDETKAKVATTGEKTADGGDPQAPKLGGK